MSQERDLFRLPESLDPAEYVVATYYLETDLPLYEAANALAAEQSTGTWKRVGEESDDLRDRHGAKVIGIYPVPLPVNEEHLPRAAERHGELRGAVVRLAFPHLNFGPKVANLLSAVAGNLYEMGAFTAMKLLDLEFPETYRKGFPGPRFGLEGTREILGVYDRPLFGAIIKPCVGLSPEALAELAYQGARGGLDFLKDDELMADTDYNSLRDRVRAVTAALRRAEEETGEKKMYAFNITDRADRVRELHDVVVEAGGRAVMLNIATAGLPVLQMLAEFTAVPVHAHRDFAPAITRSPYLGINFAAYTKLFRLVGADQVHVGAIQGKLYETDEEVLANTRSALAPFGEVRRALPVSSGGQWAGKVAINVRKFGGVDFLHLSGAGVYAHPDGPAAGARSIRQAWEAHSLGIPLEEYAREKPELARAIAFFGGS